MAISGALIIVALLAGGCLGEKNKFKLPVIVDGLIVGIVAATVHYVIQVRVDPGYWFGNPVFTAIIPFLVFWICGIFGWAVAYYEDKPILADLGKPD